MTDRKILKVDASARFEGSVTRELSALLADRLAGPDGAVVERDLAKTPVPQIDERWVGANFTPEDARNQDQKDSLALSDSLVEELKVADTLVIGLPIYNFGIPAAVKAWIDHVARARVTFKYTENGPVGLLENKVAYLVVSSGGTTVGSEIDFATGYMKHVLGFMGIHDVRIVSAERWMSRSEEDRQAVYAQIGNIIPDARAA